MITPQQCIDAYEQQVSANGGDVPPHLMLTVYDSESLMALPGESVPAGGLENHLRCIAALTEHARHRGSIVWHKTLDAEAYYEWLAHRADTRAHRAAFLAGVPPAHPNGPF